MFSQPATGRAQLAVLLLLATLTVGAFCTRIVAIAEPLGIDQSLWASAANGMAHGQRLYRDVWEQRPPGIYWIYEAGFRLLGSTPATVVWLDILASAATCLLLFLIARSLSTPLTAALAAALYAVLTMPSWLYGYGGFLERSVCETFISTCVAIATYAAVHVAKRRSLAASFVLGLAAGAAVVLKPNAGLYFPALLLWIVSFRGARGMVAPGIMAMAGGAVVPALALLWLWRLDLLLDARIAVLDFNRYYVGQGFVPGGYLVNFAKAVWLRIKTDPLWLAGIIGAGVAVGDFVRRRTMPPLAALASILGAAAVIVIVVNGARLFNSYFINALVPLSLMAAWWLGDAAVRTRPRQALATVDRPRDAGAAHLARLRRSRFRMGGGGSRTIARPRGQCGIPRSLRRLCDQPRLLCTGQCRARRLRPGTDFARRASLPRRHQRRRRLLPQRSPDRAPVPARQLLRRHGLSRSRVQARAGVGRARGFARRATSSSSGFTASRRWRSRPMPCRTTLESSIC